jgi:hypothetical protein
MPIAPVAEEAGGLFQEALELFERLGDRRGAMSTIIAMGYLSWGPDIHLGSNAARHIEEIRRLTSRMRAFTTESERAAFEAQLLYGVHVFARGKVPFDLAVSRGEEAHARPVLGDRISSSRPAGRRWRTSTWRRGSQGRRAEEPRPRPRRRSAPGSEPGVLVHERR